MKWQDRIATGSIVKAKQDVGSAKAGELGLVYETYTIGTDHWGAGIIFKEGFYDGFSLDDLDLFIEDTEEFVLELCHYRCASVIRLAEDYRAGRFEKAFQGIGFTESEGIEIQPEVEPEPPTQLCLTPTLLRALCIEWNLAQDQMAVLLGVNYGTVLQWFNREKVPLYIAYSIQNLQRLPKPKLRALMRQRGVHHRHKE